MNVYCSLLNINLLSTGLWYEKYDTYGKVCTELFLVNVRSMHVLPRVVDAEIMQSKLNFGFINFTNALFCIMSMSMSMDTFSTCSGTFRNFVRFVFFTKSYTIRTNMIDSVFYSTKCIIWEILRRMTPRSARTMASLISLSSRFRP